MVKIKIKLKKKKISITFNKFIQTVEQSGLRHHNKQS